MTDFQQRALKDHGDAGVRGGRHKTASPLWIFLLGNSQHDHSRCPVGLKPLWHEAGVENLRISRWNGDHWGSDPLPMPALPGGHVEMNRAIKIFITLDQKWSGIGCSTMDSPLPVLVDQLDGETWFHDGRAHGISNSLPDWIARGKIPRRRTR